MRNILFFILILTVMGCVRLDPDYDVVDQQQGASFEPNDWMDEINKQEAGLVQDIKALP